jgi:hypothetical protein
MHTDSKCIDYNEGHRLMIVLLITMISMATHYFFVFFTAVP